MRKASTGCTARSTFAGHEDATDQSPPSRAASISPDGRWLAFVMTQDGRARVYVQRFPGTGQAVQVSLASAPRIRIFRPQGRELYLRRGPQVIAIRGKRRTADFVTTGRAHCRQKCPGSITTSRSSMASRPMGAFLRWQRPGNRRLRVSTSSSTGPRGWDLNNSKLQTPNSK